MKISKLAVIALPLLMSCAAAPASAYDNDDQALRLRDIVADPSVPLAWDRRHRDGYGDGGYSYGYGSRVYGSRHHRCGSHAYWDGDDCVLKRRWR